jgi:hypothetical protein
MLLGVDVAGGPLGGAPVERLPGRDDVAHGPDRLLYGGGGTHEPRPSVLTCKPRTRSSRLARPGDHHTPALGRERRLQVLHSGARRSRCSATSVVAAGPASDLGQFEALAVRPRAGSHDDLVGRLPVPGRPAGEASHLAVSVRPLVVRGRSGVDDGPAGRGVRHVEVHQDEPANSLGPHRRRPLPGATCTRCTCPFRPARPVPSGCPNEPVWRRAWHGPAGGAGGCPGRWPGERQVQWGSWQVSFGCGVCSCYLGA